ncbi:MAG: 3,4-dihydroxy-2-butanone-4-phosphate synthase [Candidatus Thermoplasmatota archaeon]
MPGDNVEEACARLMKGEFVFVFDADEREGETDFIALANRVIPAHIQQMRLNGGGLIFLMVHHDIAERFRLPFLTDLYGAARGRFPVLDALVPNDIPYDTRSSFSLTINHRRTFTGITDKDRALTIRRLGELANELSKSDGDWLHALGAEFRSPGHVPVCRSSPQPLEDRVGHTELAVALALMTSETPVLVGCEMMGQDHNALSKAEAKLYAQRQGSVFLEGMEIKEAWDKWSG